MIAVESVGEERGPGRRASVWVRGLPEPLIASRSEGAIIDDLVTPADEAARVKQQRSMLQEVAKTFDAIPPLLRRVLKEENGVDLDAVVSDIRRVLS